MQAELVMNVRQINHRTDARRERLKEIIKEKSYITEGNFTLASGATSYFFFDMKPTLLSPEGATLAAEMILDNIRDDRITAVGGLVIGACPIASAVCVRSHERGAPVNAFYVRKEPKKRGTQKMIEGASLCPGDRVAVVEDVTTSGASALQAVEEVKALGCEVVKIISIVDREQGARENFASKGMVFESIFSRHDFD